MARKPKQNATADDVIASRGSYVTTIDILAGGHMHAAGEPVHEDVSDAEIESMLRMHQIVDPTAAEEKPAA